ncbi:ADP-ribose diphosphatase [Parasalinivibrio latis]|uniref:ADP-ribose diphosphatase n=1 Tax=Parasalinivibrio latis TaxID=2952610 RepID=UPI0030DF74EA
MASGVYSPTFTRDDAEVTAVETVYDGYFKMHKYAFRHRLFSGGWSEVIERELFERGHAVAVLPYDPVSDRVVMVEQIRVGAMVAGQSSWQLEIVAGVIDKGQTSEQVAYREAEEEAGLQVESLQKITRYMSSSGGCSESLDVYLGIVDAGKAEGIHGLPEEGEDILVHVLSREEAYKLVENGTIENAASIIAIQWLQLHHQRLRENAKVISGS